MNLAVVRLTPELMEVEFRSLGTREVVVAYVRENQVVITREENGNVLQAAVFGDECLKVVRAWLENPMAAGDKAEAIERMRGIKL